MPDIFMKTDPDCGSIVVALYFSSICKDVGFSNMAFKLEEPFRKRFSTLKDHRCYYMYMLMESIVLNSQPYIGNCDVSYI
jgi:hypothetical protein